MGSIPSLMPPKNAHQNKPVGPRVSVLAGVFGTPTGGLVRTTILTGGLTDTYILRAQSLTAAHWDVGITFAAEVRFYFRDQIRKPQPELASYTKRC